MSKITASHLSQTAYDYVRQSTMSAIGIASPERLHPRQVPGAVRLAANPAGFLGAAHRCLAHADLAGELTITAGAHPYIRRPVKS
jgi:hypothetical protein